MQDSGSIAAPTRGGGGLADAAHADVPLVLASPASVSFGLVRPATAVASQVELADAGGGAGVWDVSIERSRPRPVPASRRPHRLRPGYAPAPCPWWPTMPPKET